jgi:hypothetical protein
MMPGSWEFENFEAWSPGSTWAQGMKEVSVVEEYEPFGGRKNYADKQAGGYYASRIACIEKLVEMRRQARILVFREISEGYVVPLGVWVVRETARHAYRNEPMKFSTKAEAIAYAKSRLRVPFARYEKQSRLLSRRTLADF